MVNDFIKQINADRLKNYYASIGQGAIDLFVNIIGMILVERALEPEGLGIFAFILSLYFTTGYFAEFGIPDFLEKKIALNPDNRTGLIVDAKNAIRLSGLIVAALFFIAAFKGASFTRIEDTFVIYFIIGLSIFFRNGNRLKLSILQGTENHTKAAGYRTKKRLLYLVVLFLLIFIINLQQNNRILLSSFLALALFIPEIIQSIQLRSVIKLPGFFRTGLQIKKSVEIFKESKYFIVSGDIFELLLYTDFLILGMLVSAENLGIYSEASILARFFLLIPVSIRPVIRNSYCKTAANCNIERLKNKFNRFSSIVFFINSVIALYLLIYFRPVINLFFINHGETLYAYRVFIILLPGLLYFSVALVKEPLYEATENQKRLQAMVIILFMINIGLNLYLIPYAGIKGAACASMFSMFFFFLICEINMKIFREKTVFSWFMGGIWICFIYIISVFAKGYPLSTIFLIPAVLFICFYLSGFFDIIQDKSKVINQ